MTESINLQTQIEGSQTESSIREKTLDIINTAEGILKKISKDFPENYSKAKVEYQELHSTIKESVISENVITKSELENIKKEFGDINVLNQTSDIDSGDTSFGESCEMRETQFFHKFNMNDIEYIRYVEYELEKNPILLNELSSEEYNTLSDEFKTKLFNKLTHLIIEEDKMVGFEDEMKYITNADFIIDFGKIYNYSLASLNSLHIDIRSNLEILKVMEGAVELNQLPLDSMNVNYLTKFFKNVNLYENKTINYVIGHLNTTDLGVLLKTLDSEQIENWIKVLPKNILEDKNFISTYLDDYNKLVKSELNNLNNISNINENEIISIISDSNFNYSTDVINRDKVVQYIRTNSILSIELKAALIKIPNFFPYLPALHSDKDFSKNIIKDDPSSFRYLSLDLKKDPELIKILLLSNKGSIDSEGKIYNPGLDEIQYINIETPDVFELIYSILKDDLKWTDNQILSDMYINYALGKLIKKEQILGNFVEKDLIIDKFAEKNKKLIEDTGILNAKDRFIIDFEQNIMAIINKYNPENGTNGDLYKLLSSNTSAEVIKKNYSKLLELSGGNEKNLTKMIKEINEIELKKEKEVLNRDIVVHLNISEKYLLKNEKGENILNKEFIQSDFLDFTSQVTVQENETSEQYNIRLIEEYLEKNSLNDIENTPDIREKLVSILKIQQKEEELENFDTYIAYVSGKITHEEYKEEVKETKKLQNNIQDIDNREEKSIEYSNENYYIDTTDSENNFIVSRNSTEKIEISKKEALLVKESPKALKNLIDTNEKLDLLGLDFIWKYREKFIPIMKSTPGFEDVKMDTSDDFINPTEFNNLLRYILTLLGKEPSDSNSGNISKIRNISQVGALNDEKNSITKYGIIGSMFKEIGYIGVSSIDTTNVTKMQNYKQSLQDYKTKK